MDDVAKRVEQGKDDLIRKLMGAKAARRRKAKEPQPEPEQEAAPEQAEDAPVDGISDEEKDELLRLYADQK